MQLSSLEILEQAKFPQEQARAIVRVLEAESTVHRNDLATKTDLKVVLAELKSELTRQMYTAMAAQLALLVGILYFFSTHVSK